MPGDGWIVVQKKGGAGTLVFVRVDAEMQIWRDQHCAEEGNHTLEEVRFKMRDGQARKRVEELEDELETIRDRINGLLGEEDDDEDE